MEKRAKPVFPHPPPHLIEKIQILRFWNGDVMNNIEGVLDVILEELEGLEGLTEEAPEVRGREVRIVERE